MTLKTKICTRCEKEKAITSFEKRDKSNYCRRLCNDCHSQRVEKAKKKKEEWEKIKIPPKIFKIFKKEKLEGSLGKYYSFFCEIRECGTTTDSVAKELKNKFHLNIEYATQLAKEFQSGNIKKIILDYEKNLY